MGGMGMMGMPMGGMGMAACGMGGMGMPGMRYGRHGHGMVHGRHGIWQCGGSFQGAFNGSLGAIGATQAAGLIDIVTRIVDPGNWNQPAAFNQFAMGGMPMFAWLPRLHGVGMIGMVGMMGGMGMIGAGPPRTRTSTPDPQTSNSIDFFPPALAPDRPRSVAHAHLDHRRHRRRQGPTPEKAALPRIEPQEGRPRQGQ